MPRIIRARDQAELLSHWLREAAALDDLQLGNPGLPLGTPLEGVPDPERDPRGKLAEAGLGYDDMVSNLVSHYNGSTRSQRKNGRLWYRVANRIFKGMGKDAGVDHARAIAVGAATSPNTDWNENIKHAGTMLMHYRPNDPGHNENDWMMAHVHPEALKSFQAQHGRGPTDSDEDLHSLADHHQGYWPNSQANIKNGLLGNHDIANNPEARASWMQNIQHHGIDTVLADSAGQQFANRAKPGWGPSVSQRDIIRRDLGGDDEGGPKGTLSSNIKKAKAVIRAPKGSTMADYAAIINGPKVRNFSTNIIDPTRMDASGYLEHPNGDWTQHADLGGTIDAHHLRASTMAHGQWERKGYRDEKSKLDPSNPFTYDVYNRGLLDATRQINAQEADPRKHLTPKQVQAVIWLKHKADNERFKAMPINHESEITPRILRDHKLKMKKKEEAAERKRQREMMTAALEPEEMADMPPLWRRMFMTRVVPEWTDLLDAWVNHYSPEPNHPEGIADREIQAARAALALVDRLAGGGYDNPWEGPDAEDLSRDCPYCDAPAFDMHQVDCPSLYTDTPGVDKQLLGPNKYEVPFAEHPSFRLNSILAYTDRLLHISGKPSSGALYVLLPHWDPEACAAILHSHAAAQQGRTAAPLMDKEWMGDVMDAAHQGGFTLHDHVGDGPTSGYMVSLCKDSEFKTPIEHLNADHVRDFVDANADALSKPHNYLGGWLENGHFYLDVSTHIPEMNRATTEAVRNRQLGIYDLNNGRTIHTDEAGWLTGHPGIVGSRDYGQRTAAVSPAAQGRPAAGGRHPAEGRRSAADDAPERRRRVARHLDAYLPPGGL